MAIFQYAMLQAMFQAMRHAGPAKSWADLEPLGSLESPLRAHVSVFYPSRRSDLDCALVYDCLQQFGVIANDRFIVEKHEFLHIDKQNPRVEITVEEI